MIDEYDKRQYLVEYIEYARDMLAELLSEPMEPWTTDELSEISEAADQLTDVYKIMRDKRRDREILASWLKPTES